MSKSHASFNRSKEKNQHIQVFVRVRPFNHNESIGKSFTIIEVAPPKELHVREKPTDRTTKKFTFDKVFGPESNQLVVYNSVVSPLISEVIAGYNCTVFAYGQTGTGKTFTMEGSSNDPAVHWQADTPTGIIPRSLSHLFDQLRLQGSQEYTIKVSFLELYNEELFDLLDSGDGAPKLRLYDDTSKKGSVIIQGLEEIIVHNKEQVYKILEKGSERRQTAATLMNAHSSRSHTVFSVTVHMKEVTLEGEEFIKIGKLNLVDLAGSENVGRSGAIDRRAREAGNINQSLLTLGRVITALVERAPHVPYRESKLTRLLQESLGGRTKTSIIATISPSSFNLEETLSTLDYAHRAKNITNRPEINQKLMKATLIKEYTEEIERLKRDVIASRERNGVFLAPEDYAHQQATIAFQEKEIEEKLNHIKALEEVMATKEQLFNELQMNYTDTKEKVSLLVKEKDEQEFLIKNYEDVKEKLTQQANVLVKVAETVTNDTEKLHEKISRKDRVESENLSKAQIFNEQINKDFDDVKFNLNKFVHQSEDFLKENQEFFSEQVKFYTPAVKQAIHLISKEMMENVKTQTGGFAEFLQESQQRNLDWAECQSKYIADFDEKQQLYKNVMEQFAMKIEDNVNNKIIENLSSIETKMEERLGFILQSLINQVANTYEEKIIEQNKIIAQMENMIVAHNKNIQDQQDLKKKEELLKKLDEEWWDKRRKIIEESKIFSENSIKLSHETVIASQNVKTGLEIIMKEDSKLRDYVYTDTQENIKCLKENIQKIIIENREIIAKNTTNTKNIMQNLKTNLNKVYMETKSYRNSVDVAVKDREEKLQSEFSESLQHLKKVENCIDVSRENHSQFMESFKDRIISSTHDQSNKLTEQNNQTVELINNIEMKLENMTDQIEKFLKNELKRDEPTGSTPVKQQYNFPRALVTMSPKERLLQRYHLMMNQENSENSDEDRENIDTNSNENNNFSTPQMKPDRDSLKSDDYSTNSYYNKENCEIIKPKNYQKTSIGKIKGSVLRSQNN